MRPITVASLFLYNQHDKGRDRKRQGFQHPLLINMSLCSLINSKAHDSSLITHNSLLIVAPVAVPRPSDGIMGVHLIPRVKEPATIRPSGIASFRRHTFRTRDNHENASGRQDFPHKHEKRKRRDVCVQRPRFLLTQIAPIPKV